jgi:hypothetical protein
MRSKERLDEFPIREPWRRGWTLTKTEDAGPVQPWQRSIHSPPLGEDRHDGKQVGRDEATF